MAKTLFKTFLIGLAVYAVFFALLNSGLIHRPFQSYPDVDTVKTAAVEKIPARLFPIARPLGINHGQARIGQIIDLGQRIQTSAPTGTGPILQIPSLGIKAPIVFEPSTDENVIYKSLEKGIVHYSETPRPGEKGVSIILGHSSAYSWYRGDYGSIFSQISKLKDGDVILIDSGSQKLSYEVSRSIIFSPKTETDFELRELELANGSSIVLMTCWPTGTNAKRIAVRADLI